MEQDSRHESVAAFQRATQLFRTRHKMEPDWVALAPGRVNLIGEHTDYNEGFTLPLAVELYTAVAGAFSHDDRTRVFSEHAKELVEFSAGEFSPGTFPAWSRYVAGVLHGFRTLATASPPLNLVVCSDVPPGGGVSSSAALEVATAYLLQEAWGVSIDGMAIAKVCQRAEHDFAGVPCGLMDQVSSIFGQAGNLMLLDCRWLEVEQIPLPADEVSFLVINSNVRHDLADGQYRIRREQCEQAARTLQVAALRDVEPGDLHDSVQPLPPELFRRAQHVITENSRTQLAAEFVRSGDWPRLGGLMYASHESLRSGYEVTCPETDLLVQLAMTVGVAGGVFGSRMTGAGFGGCTVTLVRRQQAGIVGQILSQLYFGQTGVVADWFVTTPADGAQLINAGNDPLGVQIRT